MRDSGSDPLQVVRVALALAPPRYLASIREEHVASGLARAVRDHDTPAIFDWIVPQLALQGVSDRAARSFALGRAPVRYNGLTKDLAAAACPRLRSWWSISGCAFRKSARTCAEPHHQAACPLARLDLRKGTLAIAAAGLALFGKCATVTSAPGSTLVSPGLIRGPTLLVAVV